MPIIFDSEKKIVEYSSFVCSVRIDTAQNVHQCGFAGTVLTNESVNFTFFNLQIYIVQCFNARE